MERTETAIDGVLDFIRLFSVLLDLEVQSRFAHCCHNNEPAGCAFDFLGTF